MSVLEKLVINLTCKDDSNPECIKSKLLGIDWEKRKEGGKGREE